MVEANLWMEGLGLIMIILIAGVAFSIWLAKYITLFIMENNIRKIIKHLGIDKEDKKKVKE